MVVSATVGFQVIFSAAASLIEAIIKKSIDLNDVWFFIVLTLVAGGILSWVASYFLNKLNRSKINKVLLVIIGMITSVSAVSMVVNIVLGYINFGSEYMIAVDDFCHEWLTIVYLLCIGYLYRGLIRCKRWRKTWSGYKLSPVPLLSLLTRLRTQYSCYTLVVLQLFLQPGYCQPYIIHCLPFEAVQNYWLLRLRWKFRVSQRSYLLHIWHLVEEWSGLTLLFGLRWSLHIRHRFEYHICCFLLWLFLFGLLHFLLGLFQRLQHLPVYLVIERWRKVTLLST